MTAQPESKQRPSIQLPEVFPTQKAAMESCDATDSSSSSLLASSAGSILRVATLEESLSHFDIDRSGRLEEEEEEKAPPALNDSSSKNNKVTFTDVVVREYPICLGDNPAVMIGAPLSIGWEVQSEGKLSLDDYESSRPDRRRSEELRIPSFVRETMLKSSGYSRMDIQKGVKDVNISRNRRKRTNETHQLYKAQELAERLVRASLNATVRRSQKKQEKDLIQHFRQEAETLRTQHKATRRSTWHAAAAPATAPVEATRSERRGTWHAAAITSPTATIGASAEV
ncbi:expressed unknown protein [Seminavis robusta]|uniref:Uncharacterized protein n=1 Tax=Seminavis robusta TaxID=568900 RepID=A0A9N8HX99_9STRA|nr:expressed unknown protein [Seminavis robusta]|eukprot:Sro2989_g341770.1 n/a (284) ;mRNA; f:4694-5545